MNLRRQLHKASVALVVASLHLVGFLAWWSTERGPRLAQPAQRSTPIAVWLPALAEPEVERPPATRKAQQPPANSLPRQADKRPAPQNATASAGAAPPSNGVLLPAQANDQAQGQAPASTAPPLNLNLSRQALTAAAPPSFADQSPFHGRLPATVERQIAAAAAESGPWTEERIDNDHVRFRRGNTCINLQRPRAAIIDPMNEAMARIPWRSSGLEECK